LIQKKGLRFRTYRFGSDFGAGFGTEFGFFAGLETPRLMRKKRNPLRRESRRLIEFPQYTIAEKQGTRELGIRDQGLGTRD
jgi:hypothetical protein